MAPWDPPEDLEKLQESRKTSLQCSLSQFPIEDSPLGGPRPRQDSQFAGGQWDRLDGRPGNTRDDVAQEGALCHGREEGQLRCTAVISDEQRRSPGTQQAHLCAGPAAEGVPRSTGNRGIGTHTNNSMCSGLSVDLRRFGS